MTPEMRDFLVRVDSVCSYAAYRGIDFDTRQELIVVSAIARKMYEEPGDASDATT